MLSHLPPFCNRYSAPVLPPRPPARAARARTVPAAVPAGYGLTPIRLWGLRASRTRCHPHARGSAPPLPRSCPSPPAVLDGRLVDPTSGVLAHAHAPQTTPLSPTRMASRQTCWRCWAPAAVGCVPPGDQAVYLRETSRVPPGDGFSLKCLCLKRVRPSRLDGLDFAVRLAVDEALAAQAHLPSCDTWRAAQRTSGGADHAA
jgi:hypothetical protein